MITRHHLTLEKCHWCRPCRSLGYDRHSSVQLRKPSSPYLTLSPPFFSPSPPSPLLPLSLPFGHTNLFCWGHHSCLVGSLYIYIYPSCKNISETIEEEDFMDEIHVSIWWGEWEVRGEVRGEGWGVRGEGWGVRGEGWGVRGEGWKVRWERWTPWYWAIWSR